MSRFFVVFALSMMVAGGLEAGAQPVPGQSAASQYQFGTTPPGVADSGGSNLDALRGALPVPVQIEPAVSELDVSKGQKWHRASMHLTGSMCPACLLELEHKLRALPGVDFASITRESAGLKPKANQTSAQVGKRTAPTVIIYDACVIAWERLQDCIKQEKYRAADLSDRLLAPVSDSAASVPPATPPGQTGSFAPPGK